MQVLAFQTVAFRNLASQVIEPGPRCNVFAGPNGHGKTNLLEAIYLLGTLRSFRADKSEEMIGFGAANAQLRARVRKLSTERRLEVLLQPGQKQAQVDGKNARQVDYFAAFNVVLFVSEDLRLPRGAPALRRRYLDRAIWNCTPDYLDRVQVYERTLRSRNALLKEKTHDPQLLTVYDEQLSAAAVPLVMRRRRFVDELTPYVERTFTEITAGEISVALRYQTECASVEAEIAMQMRAALDQNLRRDLQRGMTSVGPHKDDLIFTIDGKSAELYASQGQLRALVLALKMAEIELLTKNLGDSPVLLLDDVSSELDASRNRQLFDFLRQMSCQTWVTTTDPKHVLLVENRVDFQLLRGEILR